MDAGSLGSLRSGHTLGLFTWSDRRAFRHCELDVEVAFWGGLVPRVWFSVQHPGPVRQRSVLLPSVGERRVFVIVWRRGSVVFKLDGVRVWRVLRDVPVPSRGLVPAMNLWVDSGVPGVASVRILGFDFLRF